MRLVLKRTKGLLLVMLVFDNLSGSHLHSSLKMTSAQAVKTSVIFTSPRRSNCTVFILNMVKMFFFFF